MVFYFPLWILTIHGLKKTNNGLHQMVNLDEEDRCLFSSSNGEPRRKTRWSIILSFGPVSLMVRREKKQALRRI